MPLDWFWSCFVNDYASFELGTEWVKQSEKADVNLSSFIIVIRAVSILLWKQTVSLHWVSALLIAFAVAGTGFNDIDTAQTAYEAHSWDCLSMGSMEEKRSRWMQSIHPLLLWFLLTPWNANISLSLLRHNKLLLSCFLEKRIASGQWKLY